MNTTATIFFLLLGQADGSIGGTNPGNVAVIPHQFASQRECAAAGEAARANNQGLSYLSYTCVPVGGAELTKQRFLFKDLTFAVDAKVVGTTASVQK